MSRPNPAVHWEEGMYLCPQHMQGFAQHLDFQLAVTGLGSGPFHWGLNQLEIDLGALKTHQLVVTGLDVVTPQGTRVSVPGTARLKARPFEIEFAESRGMLEVHLGVPIQMPGEPAIVTLHSPAGRYEVDEGAEQEDENTGTSPQSVKRRYLNARLFLGGEPTAGYDVVKIGELQRKSKVDPEPVLSPTYIPPLLRTLADARLSRLIKEVCDELKATNGRLAQDISQRPVTWAMKAGADALFKLQTTNTYAPVVEQACLSDGVHPFHAYLILCQLAGALAVFDEQKRSCPDIYLYDHQRLGELFRHVCGLIKELLAKVYKTTYDFRPFEPSDVDPQRLDAELLQEWLQPDWSMYLAVEYSDASIRNIDDLHRVVTGNLKLAATPDVSNVFGTVVRGLYIAPVTQAPASLPPLDSTHYFLIDERHTDAIRWRALQEADTVSLGWTGEPVPGLTFYLYAGMNSP